MTSLFKLRELKRFGCINFVDNLYVFFTSLSCRELVNILYNRLEKKNINRDSVGKKK